MIPIRVSNTAEIEFYPLGDRITLEYDDRVLLRFTPDVSSLEGDVEGVGEYIRSNATINIIDYNRKLLNFIIITFLLCFNEDRAGDKFWSCRLYTIGRFSTLEFSNVSSTQDDTKSFSYHILYCYHQ